MIMGEGNGGVEVIEGDVDGAGEWWLPSPATGGLIGGLRLEEPSRLLLVVWYQMQIVVLRWFVEARASSAYSSYCLNNTMNYNQRRWRFC